MRDVCVCVCVYMFVGGTGPCVGEDGCVNLCICKPEDKVGYPFPVLGGGVSHWVQLTVWLGWVASESQESARLCLPSAGVIRMCHYACFLKMYF